MAGERFDVVIVGSGINALVCASLLSLSGRKVCVLERNAVAGGCIRTEELTEPGFLHDTLSTLYPLFVTTPHFTKLEAKLAERGARFVNGDKPTAVVLPDGRSLILRRDRAANVAALDACAAGDGAAYQRAMAGIEDGAPLIFGLLGGSVWSWKTGKLLLAQARARGMRGLIRFFGEAMRPTRDWLAAEFRSEEAKALLAPWVLHVGLGPDAPLSAMMNALVLFTLEAAGSPMIEGGSARIVEAFTRIIEEAGGAVRAGSDVVSIDIANGRASGVALADGSRVAGLAVVASVTPTQLYGKLVPAEVAPREVRADAAAFRYGRGEMQIHLALSEKPLWPDPALAEVAMLHVTAGLDAVSRAVNEAERGLLPAEATIVVAQPIAIDPSRAPDGKWIFWI